MRCNECNVDLGESYTICPLCGAQAVDAPPVIAGVEEANYPDVSGSFEDVWAPDTPSKAVFRVTAPLALIFLLLGTSIPSVALISGCACYYFVCALREPGRLLHAGLSSCLTLLVSAALLVCAIVLGAKVWLFLLCVVLCAMLFAILCVSFPERMREQFRAAFHR